MTALIKKNLRRWGFGKALALFAGCLVFSSSGRLHTRLSFEQHILSAASDHYYLTYYMLAIVLLSCFSFLDDDEEAVILRFGSYHAYFCQKWLGTWLIAGVLVAVQAAAILLSGGGLASGNHWALYTGAPEAELFGVLKQYFSSPLQAFALMSLYQLFGTWIIFGVGMWLGHFTGHSVSCKIFVALYGLAAVWIKAPAIQTLPLTGLNHLLIVHHNLSSPYRLALTLATAGVLILSITFSVRFAWSGWGQRIKAPKPGLARYYLRLLCAKRNLAIFIAVVLSVVIYHGLGNAAGDCGEAWVYSLFAGHGTGYFRLLPFLELLIVNGTPLYLLGVFMEQTISGQSLFVAIRAGSRQQLLLAVLSASMRFLALYAFFWLIGGVLGSVLLGCGFTLSTGKLLLYAVICKYFDLLLHYLLMLALYLITKQITIGFLALVCANWLCILPFKWVAYLPLGLSSLTRIRLYDSSFGISALAALCVTILSIICILLWLPLFGRQKI